MEVVPEHTSRQVSHSVEVVVCYHLRLTRGTAGEIHQHGILIVVDVLWTYEFRSLLPFALPVAESFRNGFPVIGDGNQRIHRRTLGHSQFDLLCHVWIIHTDNRLDAGSGIAIYDIMLSQHVGSRNDDGSDLTECQHDDPPLVSALQDEHHGVVLADAQ